ncbi:MAG: hypothetical protein EA428_16130, partial [Spirochaetaceae bacterium]
VAFGNQNWIQAQPGMALGAGDMISSSFGAGAVLRIGDAVLTVRPLTRLRIDELAEREGVLESDLFLQVGRVRSELRSGGDRVQEFRMRSPVATAAVRGTAFEFDGVNLEVFDGSVMLSNSFGQTRAVRARESSAVLGGLPPTAPLAARAGAVTVVPYPDSARERSTGTGQTEAAPPVGAGTASVLLELVVE